jgi:hypothetical protein
MGPRAENTGFLLNTFNSKESNMEVNDYCRHVEMELNSWKTRFYDVVWKACRIPAVDTGEIFEDINGIHIIITQLEARIDRLRAACPRDWGTADRDIRVRLGDLESRCRKASKVFIGYDFSG